MDNLDQAIKQAKDERDDLIIKAEALIEESDGSLDGEQKEQFESYKDQIDKKNEYIDAKRWQAEQRANGSGYEKNDSGERKELSKFSMTRFLLSTDPKLSKHLTDAERGFYNELHKDGLSDTKDAGITTSDIEGLVVPKKALSSSFRNDLTIGTEGGDVTFDMDGGFIDALEDRLVLRPLGTDFATGLIGDLKFPRESNTLTATWEGETDANTEQTPTYDNVSLSPKRLSFFVDISKQALLQTSPVIQARVENAMVSAVQRGLESAAINGSGSGAVPEGILNTTGIGDAPVGTNGGAQTWGHWVDNETNVSVANADIGNLNYLTNAPVRGQAKKTIVDSGSGQFLWPVNATEVNGYNVGVSNLVPSDLTKGTGTGLSALIFGNFNDLVIGQWGGLDVLVDPYTQAGSGLIRIHINMYADVAVLHAESFSATQDIDTTA